jgi:hypothetical protein
VPPVLQSARFAGQQHVQCFGFRAAMIGADNSARNRLVLLFAKSFGKAEHNLSKYNTYEKGPIFQQS